MANPKKLVPENVPGDFFVDSTCIDCDACRQIAPSVFGEAAETSYVKTQPVASADRRQALQALLACPTGSIGCLGDDDVKAVMKDFPLVVEGPVHRWPSGEYAGPGMRHLFLGPTRRRVQPKLLPTPWLWPTA